MLAGHGPGLEGVDAVDDHQSANARFMVERDAAWLVPQTELAARLGDVLGSMIEDRGELTRRATNARALSRPDATERVADICLETIDA